jgi:hypothetical protein
LGGKSKISRLVKFRRIQGKEKKMTGTRLNDCDLAPGEKAKYDAEREAQIARAKLYIRSDRYVSNPTKPPPRTQDFIAWLDAALAALEEARTEATVVMEQLRKTCAEILGTDTDWPNYALTVTELDGKRREVAEALARLRADAGDTEVNYARELSRMKAEIARLRAPPAADVMELARSLLDFTGYPPPNQTKKEWIEECVARVARALTTYGDQLGVGKEKFKSPSLICTLAPHGRFCAFFFRNGDGA